jgi:hypothetical protein
MRGIDYLRVRAAGRRKLGLRGTVETDDGNRICLHPRDSEPVVDLL